MVLLSVQSLSKKEKGNIAVQNISFSQNRGEKIGIAGETGSGKTTLMKMIAGFVQPDEGSVYVGEERIRGPHEKLIPGHKKIAYLSQHFELPPHYWIHEILEYANLLQEHEAQELYAICRITHLTQRRTDQLSGGERQRVALARLLSTSPSLLLLDEPFSNLDAVHTRIIRSVIHDISTKLGITSIMVSHDPQDILSWADRIFLMKDGAIIQEGTAVDVYQKPLNEYCAGLLGGYNIIEKDSPLYLQFNKNGNDSNRFIVRPSNIIITRTAGAGAPATISEILFWGDHYTINVEIDGKIYMVNTLDQSFVVGEKIFLSFTENAVQIIK